MMYAVPTRPLLASLLTSLLLLFIAATPAKALPVRDHLTEQEADLVREAQQLDKRTAIFIRAIERRLLAMTDPSAATSKQVQKETEKWGELPKGTRAELLGDIAKILDEAITNIEDVSEHDENNPLIAKALRLLSAASTRFIAQLTPMRDGAKEGERDSLEQALESAQSVIAAANKLPPETVKEKKKKS
jgi:hypothetical protein